jgi:formate hydrogenlyase transcriptional activator
MRQSEFAEESIIDRPIDCEANRSMRISPAAKTKGALVGKSPAFQHVLALAREVAPTPTTVLITGEMGTGKELVAQAIHEWSPRRHNPFVRVNCAAFPAGLVESELFGHERGTFTGADCAHEGRFERADGGTLFLDEIREMPWETQAKLLRVLQDGMVDRLDDIPLLARYFLERYCVQFNRSCRDIDQESLGRLIYHTWPGNVRELENVIERALILSHEPVLRIDESASGAQGASLLEAAPPSNLKEMERRHILQTLTLVEWHIEGPDGAAARLGLPPSTLRSRMKQFGMKRPSAR